jgi:hypothetical protein
MRAFVQFENGGAALEMMSRHQSCGFELRQDPVDSGEADVLVHFEKTPVDILGTHVARLRAREDFENLHARHGDLESCPTEM